MKGSDPWKMGNRPKVTSPRVRVSQILVPHNQGTWAPGNLRGVSSPGYPDADYVQETLSYELNKNNLLLFLVSLHELENSEIVAFCG